MVNSPLIRPYLLGRVAFGGGPLSFPLIRRGYLHHHPELGFIASRLRNSEQRASEAEAKVSNKETKGGWVLWVTMLGGYVFMYILYYKYIFFLIILYYIILYCSILYHIILYYSILYYIYVLWYIHKLMAMNLYTWIYFAWIYLFGASK